MIESYPRSSCRCPPSTSLSHVMFLLDSSLPRSAVHVTQNWSIQNSEWDQKRHPIIAAFTLHPYALSLPFPPSTWDASPSDVYTRLWLSQLLPEEEYGSSPDCNTTCTQFTARKPVIYSLLYIHFSRKNTREYSWEGALPAWMNLCTTAPSFSLSLSHILGLGIT